VLYQSDNPDLTNRRPVWFYSKAATGAQTRWPAYKSEIKAFQLALEHGRQQLQFNDFTVHGDHANMQDYLIRKSLDSLDKWCSFWILYISTFTFTYKWIPGGQNLVADYFSRPPRKTARSVPNPEPLLNILRECHFTMDSEEIPDSQLSRLSLNHMIPAEGHQ